MARLRTNLSAFPKRAYDKTIAPQTTSKREKIYQLMGFLEAYGLFAGNFLNNSVKFQNFAWPYLPNAKIVFDKAQSGIFT